MGVLNQYVGHPMSDNVKAWVVKESSLAETVARYKRYAELTDGRVTGDTEPVLLQMNVSTSDDAWIRERIRAEAVPHAPMTIQRVIVQGWREADRVFAAMSRAKREKNLPFGGSQAIYVAFATPKDLGHV